ncbi:hypothetical protein A2U01_0112716, partial [Trifolium medium]|nr:hypothetical protein [Trifolium medium]
QKFRGSELDLASEVLTLQKMERFRGSTASEAILPQRLYCLRG